MVDISKQVAHMDERVKAFEWMGCEVDYKFVKGACQHCEAEFPVDIIRVLLCCPECGCDWTIRPDGWLIYADIKLKPPPPANYIHFNFLLSESEE